MVIRLDSGDPVSTVLEVLDLLEEKFGGIVKNSKGFKQMPSFLRIMQGTLYKSPAKSGPLNILNLV